MFRVVVLHHLTQLPHKMGTIGRLEGGGRYLGLLTTDCGSTFSQPLWESSVKYRHLIMTKHLQKKQFFLFFVIFNKNER